MSIGCIPSSRSAPLPLPFRMIDRPYTSVATPGSSSFSGSHTSLRQLPSRSRRRKMANHVTFTFPPRHFARRPKGKIDISLCLMCPVFPSFSRFALFPLSPPPWSKGFSSRLAPPHQLNRVGVFTNTPPQSLTKHAKLSPTSKIGTTGKKIYRKTRPKLHTDLPEGWLRNERRFRRAFPRGSFKNRDSGREFRSGKTRLWSGRRSFSVCVGEKRHAAGAKCVYQHRQTWEKENTFSGFALAPDV